MREVVVNAHHAAPPPAAPAPSLQSSPNMIHAIPVAHLPSTDIPYLHHLFWLHRAAGRIASSMCCRCAVPHSPTANLEFPGVAFVDGLSAIEWLLA